MTPEQRQHIIDTRPSWIGTPAENRHAANMIWLPIMKDQIDQQVQDHEPKTRVIWVDRGSKPGDDLNGGINSDQDRRLGQRGQKHLDRRIWRARANTTRKLRLCSYGDRRPQQPTLRREPGVRRPGTARLLGTFSVLLAGRQRRAEHLAVQQGQRPHRRRSRHPRGGPISDYS